MDNMDKIVRTLCLFDPSPSPSSVDRLQKLADKLVESNFSIQTLRVCSPMEFGQIEDLIDNDEVMVSVGTMSFDKALNTLDNFYKSRDNFNVELADTQLGLEHTEILFNIIQNAPEKTFNFTYVFNNPHSSPYMPSSSYENEGFAVGLQPTNLCSGASSLEEWFNRLKLVYQEIFKAFENETGFLGIDSSIAPLFEGDSSLINHIKRIYPAGFNQSFTSDTYTQISAFIKSQNPKLIGLSGIMMPCLEDFELAREYEQGNFSVERNIYVSLHSGLGIDTYPIGTNESPERVLEILKLVQSLSNKYKKPLSVRFVSDGKAKIGEKSNFENPYLYDLVIKEL